MITDCDMSNCRAIDPHFNCVKFRRKSEPGHRYRRVRAQFRKQLPSAVNHVIVIIVILTALTAPHSSSRASENCSTIAQPQWPQDSAYTSRPSSVIHPPNGTRTRTGQPPSSPIISNHRSRLSQELTPNSTVPNANNDLDYSEPERVMSPLASDKNAPGPEANERQQTSEISENSMNNDKRNNYRGSSNSNGHSSGIEWISLWLRAFLRGGPGSREPRASDAAPAVANGQAPERVETKASQQIAFGGDRGRDSATLMMNDDHFGVGSENTARDSSRDLSPESRAAFATMNPAGSSSSRSDFEFGPEADSGGPDCVRSAAGSIQEDKGEDLGEFGRPNEIGRAADQRSVSENGPPIEGQSEGSASGNQSPPSMSTSEHDRRHVVVVFEPSSPAAMCSPFANQSCAGTALRHQTDGTRKSEPQNSSVQATIRAKAGESADRKTSGRPRQRLEPVFGGGPKNAGHDLRVAPLPAPLAHPAAAAPSNELERESYTNRSASYTPLGPILRRAREIAIEPPAPKKQTGKQLGGRHNNKLATGPEQPNKNKRQPGGIDVVDSTKKKEHDEQKAIIGIGDSGDGSGARRRAHDYIGPATPLPRKQGQVRVRRHSPAHLREHYNGNQGAATEESKLAAAFGVFQRAISSSRLPMEPSMEAILLLPESGQWMQPTAAVAAVEPASQASPPIPRGRRANKQANGPAWNRKFHKPTRAPSQDFDGADDFGGFSKKVGPKSASDGENDSGVMRRDDFSSSLGAAADEDEEREGVDKRQLKTIYFAGFFPHLGDDSKAERRPFESDALEDEDDADAGRETIVRAQSTSSSSSSSGRRRELPPPSDHLSSNRRRFQQKQLARRIGDTAADNNSQNNNLAEEPYLEQADQHEYRESASRAPFPFDGRLHGRQDAARLAINEARERQRLAEETQSGVTSSGQGRPEAAAAAAASLANINNNNNNNNQTSSAFNGGNNLANVAQQQMFGPIRPFGKSVAPSPFNNYDQLGKLVLPAVRLALEHINKNGSLLSNYRLEIVPRDTQCNATVSLKKFFDMVYEKPKKMLLYGDACRVSTDPIAKASYFFDLIQISYADTDPIYTIENYPNFFRVIPSENALSSARIPFIRHFNWTRVGTIYQNLPRYSLPHSKLLTDLERFNIVIKQSVSLPGAIDGLQNQDLGDELRKLKERDVRIILGNFDEQWALLLFCEAYRERMTGRKYQWILTGISEDRLWRYYQQHGSACSEPELLVAMDGYIITDITPVTRSQARTISGLRAQEFSEEYRRRTQKSFLGQTLVGNLEENKFYGYVYDGIWAIALALDLVDRHLAEMHRRHKSGSVRLNPEVESLHSLDDFDYSKPIWARLIRAALNKTNFEGVTGTVSFDKNERPGLITFSQFQAHQESRSEVVIASYDALADKLDFEVGFPIFWRGSSPPIDYTIQKLTPFRINRTLFVVISILAIFGIILAIIFLTINIKFRNQRYIKMSSPYLNNLIIIGCILTYLSVIILGLDSGLTSESNFPFICNARAWVLMAGFTLAFGSMFSKTFRVHSIFTNIKLHKKVIKDYKLFMVVFILLFFDISILVVWQYFDPFYRETNNGTSIQDMEKEDVIIVPEMEHCQSHRMTIFLGIIYVYKGLLMAFGCFLAWETRHVSIPALNDSKYIGLSVYNVVIMCVIGVGLSFALRDQQDASFVINSIFIIFCSTATLCLVFVPKVRMLMELRQNPKAADQRVRATLKTFAKNYRDGNLGAAGATLGASCRDQHGNLIPGSRNQIDLNEKIRLLHDDNTKQRTTLKDKTFELEALTYKYKKICTMIQSGQYLQALNTTTAHHLQHHNQQQQQQGQQQPQSLIGSALRPTIEPATIVSPQVSFGIVSPTCSGGGSRFDTSSKSTIVKLPYSASGSFRSPMAVSRRSLSPTRFDSHVINMDLNNSAKSNQPGGHLLTGANNKLRSTNLTGCAHELTVDPSTSCSTTKMTSSYATTTGTGTTTTMDYSSMGMVLAEMSSSTGSLSCDKNRSISNLNGNKQAFSPHLKQQHQIVQQVQIYQQQTRSCGKRCASKKEASEMRKTSSVRSMETIGSNGHHQARSINNNNAQSMAPGIMESRVPQGGLPRTLSMIEFLGSLYFSKDQNNLSKLPEILSQQTTEMSEEEEDGQSVGQCCCHCEYCFGSHEQTLGEDYNEDDDCPRANENGRVVSSGTLKDKHGHANHEHHHATNDNNDSNNYSSSIVFGCCEFTSGATDSTATTSKSNSAGELGFSRGRPRRQKDGQGDDEDEQYDERGDGAAGPNQAKRTNALSIGAADLDEDDYCEGDFSFDSQLSCSLCCSGAFCSQSHSQASVGPDIDDEDEGSDDEEEDVEEEEDDDDDDDGEGDDYLDEDDDDDDRNNNNSNHNANVRAKSDGDWPIQPAKSSSKSTSKTKSNEASSSSSLVHSKHLRDTTTSNSQKSGRKLKPSRERKTKTVGGSLAGDLTMQRPMRRPRRIINKSDDNKNQKRNNNDNDGDDDDNKAPLSSPSSSTNSSASSISSSAASTNSDSQTNSSSLITSQSNGGSCDRGHEARMGQTTGPGQTIDHALIGHAESTTTTSASTSTKSCEAINKSGKQYKSTKNKVPRTGESQTDKITGAQARTPNDPMRHHQTKQLQQQIMSSPSSSNFNRTTCTGMTTSRDPGVMKEKNNEKDDNENNNNARALQADTCDDEDDEQLSTNISIKCDIVERL